MFLEKRNSSWGRLVFEAGKHLVGVCDTIFTLDLWAKAETHFWEYWWLRSNLCYLAKCDNKPYVSSAQQFCEVISLVSLKTDKKTFILYPQKVKNTQGW